MTRQSGGAPLRVLIERAEPLQATDEIHQAAAVGNETPGIILAADRSGIIVAAGNGSRLKITRLKPEGKRSLEAGEFLNGTPLSPGDRFE